MPSLQAIHQASNPMDHTTLTVNFTLRELSHLTLLLGCTHREITEEIGVIETDQEVASVYTYLLDVIKTTAEDYGIEFDIDNFQGPRLVWEDKHDHVHDESEPF